MVTQELLESIKTQLQNGQSKGYITSQLVAKGVQISDIDSAFQLVSSKTSLPPSEQPSKKPGMHMHSSVIIIFLITFVICMSGIIYYAFFRNTNSLSKRESMKRLPTAQPTVKTTNSVMSSNRSNLEGSIVYINLQGEYSFRYLKTWSIANLGANTHLAAPDNANSKKCTQIIFYCDIIIYPVPYTNVPPQSNLSHQTQVQNLANKFVGLSKGSSISPININKLQGYEVPTTSQGVTADTILLQGTKNMLLLQFVHIKSLNELDTERLTVLHSFSEL